MAMVEAFEREWSRVFGAGEVVPVGVGRVRARALGWPGWGVYDAGLTVTVLQVMVTGAGLTVEGQAVILAALRGAGAYLGPVTVHPVES